MQIINKKIKSDQKPPPPHPLACSPATHRAPPIPRAGVRRRRGRAERRGAEWSGAGRSAHVLAGARARLNGTLCW